jgi:signal transduction histidine kinase
LKPLLEDICRQARSLAPQRTVICKPFPEVLVLGNRDALKQVLLILLDNAVVHTPAQAMITLAAAETDHAVEIQVSDTGAGIAPEVLPHIFERFYRGDVARSGRSAGLGLAIARELVHAQEAAIRVESEAGRGTVFTVTCQKAIS